MRRIRCSLQHQVTMRNGNKNGANERKRTREMPKGKAQRSEKKSERARENVSTFYHALPIESRTTKYENCHPDQKQQSAQPNRVEKKALDDSPARH